MLPKCENGMAERGILFWLEEDREPTVHILNEMMDLKEKYEKYKNRLYLSFAAKNL